MPSIGSFRPRTLVQNTETGAKGVVVQDMPGPMRCCSDNEIPVVYEGTTAFFGTDYRHLKILGTEQAEASLKKCGAGKGEECCIFLSVGASGPACERFGSNRIHLLFSKMSAKRNPSEPYPQCQKF